MRSNRRVEYKNFPREIESWILLSKVLSAGFSGVNKILKELGLSKETFSAPLEKLSRISKIDREIVDFIRKKIPEINLKEDFKLIQELDIKLITFEDSFYPPNLKTIFDPPFLIYLRGELKREDEKAVALVGTRRATNYGKIVAKRLARELARAGLTVVSGMARGIDTYAHEGALEEGGRTIAVLGCGVDIVYPPEIYLIYAMLVDKEFKKILSVTPQPILAPEHGYEWELYGDVPFVVFPTGAIVSDNEVYLYYGAGDKVVMLAKADLSELLMVLDKYRGKVLAPPL